MMEEPAGEAPQNDGEQSTLISAPLKLHLHHLSRLLYNCFSAKVYNLDQNNVKYFCSIF